jgi:hypothetical protein
MIHQKRARSDISGTSSTLVGAAMNSILNIVSEQRRLTHLANATYVAKRMDNGCRMAETSTERVRATRLDTDDRGHHVVHHADHTGRC